MKRRRRKKKEDMTLNFKKHPSLKYLKVLMQKVKTQQNPEQLRLELLPACPPI